MDFVIVLNVKFCVICNFKYIHQRNTADMIKAFISHSSEQKLFVKDLVETLGRDYCIVDCYNFN